MIALKSKSERKDSIEVKKASLYFEESSKISKPSIRFMKKKEKTEIILKSLNGKKNYTIQWRLLLLNLFQLFWMLR